MNKVDRNINSSLSNWSFSGKVAKNFEKHINKSVPFYYEGQELISFLSDFFVGNDSTVYDLGCSTGVLSALISDRHIEKKFKIVSIDIEEEMISIAKKDNHRKNIEYINSNILDIEFEKSDLVICYYTLQFIPTKYRQDFLERLYKSLNWGGALILFEKVRYSNSRIQDYMTQTYQEFKIKNGFNSENILSKSRSLKKILEPYSSQGNINLLKRAGFSDIDTIHKHISFEGFIAIK